MSRPKVHALPTGSIDIRAAIHDGTAYRARQIVKLLRDRRMERIPVYAYLVEHDDGHIVIDTGFDHRINEWFPEWGRSFATIVVGAQDRIGARIRELGYRPEDVRIVVPTHMHPDHGGGVGDFPGVDVIVHRPEHDFAMTWYGAPLYQPKRWPAWFRPKVYDLDPEPYGAFPESLTIANGVRIVAIPGHSKGMVGVVVDSADVKLFFSGDHTVREGTFTRDAASGSVPRGTFYPHWRDAVITQRRLESFVRQFPTVLVPAHDPDSPRRLDELTVTRI